MEGYTVMGFPKTTKASQQKTATFHHLGQQHNQHWQCCPTSDNNLPDHWKPTLPTVTHTSAELYCKGHWETPRVSPAATTLLVLHSSRAEMPGWAQLCQLHQHQSPKPAVVTPWSPTAPREDEGKQQVRAGNLSEQQLLNLPAS